jgi:ferredoxin
MNETSGGAAASRWATLRVHPDQCQGHARCSALLPELLIQDGCGPVQLNGNGTIPPLLMERARVAVACCPEMAIEILQD